MARIPQEHGQLYFDETTRTQKAESLMALIKASYYAHKNIKEISTEESVKKEIAKRLKSGYELYRDTIKGSDSGSGSYIGNIKQFESQYTLGHEMAIWNDSSLSLTFLANKVAIDELAVKDYISNIFLSYLQPVDGNMVHPLYMILDYMENNKIRYIEKTSFEKALKVQCSTTQCNSLLNYLKNVNFFEYTKDKLLLKDEFEISEIKSKCNRLFLEDSYENINKYLSDPNAYECYLLEPYFSEELDDESKVSYEELRKIFQKWLISKLNKNKGDDSNFNGYSLNLLKIINILESKNKILRNSMYKTNIDYYDFVMLKFKNDVDAFDLDAKQNFPARASIPHYKRFIKQLKKYGLNKIKNAIEMDIDEVELNNSFCDSVITMDNNKNNFEIFDFEIKRKAKNLVVFGTPGCGKSYYVNNTLLKDYPYKSDNTKERVFRTTFYQDYTNTDFVGQILPYIEYNDKKEEKVTYKFTPGPFALALKEAVLNKNEDVALVIEELNRGNAPAIFGDIFQLLDRNQYGISEYAITNIYLRDWLNNEIEGASFDKIKIPGNLNIFATMNTSDQNVFTLDTAFKRRWQFIKLQNVFNEYEDIYGNKHTHDYKDYKVPGMVDVTWEKFVTVINDAIRGEEGERNSTINVSDKQIGIYFIDKNGLCKDEIRLDDPNYNKEVQKFAYKIFSYLWDDVAKFDKDQLFIKGIKTLDQLIDDYVNNKVVFIDSIDKSLKQKASESNEN